MTTASKRGKPVSQSKPSPGCFHPKGRGKKLILARTTLGNGIDSQSSSVLTTLTEGETRLIMFNLESGDRLQQVRSPIEQLA